MRNIYLISGLGADYRAFQRLKLPGYNLVLIEWITPVKKETLPDYAQRLLPQINDFKPIIIGLSFGGMIALEIAKCTDPAIVFLISSARSKKDLPASFSKWIQHGILKIIPEFMLRRSNVILEYLMGVSEKKERQVLAEIIADTDVSFLKWALHAMSEWDNGYLPEKTVEIHGTADRLIPFRKTKTMHAIEGGGHLMVLDRAEAISQIILSYLSTL